MKSYYSGKKVLVTGGSSTIGLCLAGLLIKEGLLPVLTYRNDSGKKKIMQTLEDTMGLFETKWFDFSDPSGINDLFKECKTDPDYLVDLAHTDYESLVASASNERMDLYFSQNIASRARLVRSASRSMLKKRFGRLVFISSAAAAMPATGQGFYASSKLACEALYKNCGLELCSRGVTSLSIRPGYVDAGRGRAFLETQEQRPGKNYGEHQEKGLLKEKLRPFMITPQELCETILFFLSDSARAFNGVSITMDYGLSSGKR
ncbi:MAG: SDR family oxidoreductase [Pseudomonadota bacterium]